MTGFDAFALLVILASAAAGWVRGGTREIIKGIIARGLGLR